MILQSEIAGLEDRLAKLETKMTEVMLIAEKTLELSESVREVIERSMNRTRPLRIKRHR